MIKILSKDEWDRLPTVLCRDCGKTISVVITVNGSPNNLCLECSLDYEFSLQVLNSGALFGQFKRTKGNKSN